MNLMLLLFASATAPDWMAGCWSGKSGPVTFEEQWSKPAGGSMMGIARTLKNGQVIFSEFMRIELRNGNLVFTPRIGTKQASVDFPLKTRTETQIVFENPAHDFPQRIFYKKVGEALHARIEGTENGKSRSEDFPMRPVDCK